MVASEPLIAAISHSNPVSDWSEFAACRTNRDAFTVPLASETAQMRENREHAATIAVCSCCMVIEQCRAYALRVREPIGIWGGLTETERREQQAPSCACPAKSLGHRGLHT